MLYFIALYETNLEKVITGLNQTEKLHPSISIITYHTGKIARVLDKTDHVRNNFQSHYTHLWIFRRKKQHKGFRDVRHFDIKLLILYYMYIFYI